MTDKSPLEFIREHVGRLAWIDPASVRADARFIDFGLDSVKAMDLVVELEEAYGVDIPEADLADLRTLQDVADYVVRRRGGP